MQNIVNNNDNFNERTNTLLYKNISLTLYTRKGWCWLCVRGELETGIDCNILTQSSSDHSSTSFSSWLGCSTVGHWGPKALCLPLALTLPSCPQLTQLQLELTQAVSGTWLYNCLTPTCFHCFSAYLTGASLDWRFGRGSIYNISFTSSICSIFSLSMESNALDKTMNNRIALQFLHIVLRWFGG